jgi:cellulose synthase/poly-beta-1,6-N-acetylglucosamine synthase-like glycosyltransferase
MPEAEAKDADRELPANVTVVPTPCRGQVAQRSFGFSKVSQPFVLQMDDDITLEHDAARRLLSTLQRLGTGNVVAPLYRDSGTGRCLHTYSKGWLRFIQHGYARLVCGAKWGIARMGTISPAGVSYGVDEALCGSDVLETSWVPGGCVLSYREDLVLENFFPFPGKAYCEDLIHSRLRERRGLRMWIDPGAHCHTPEAPAQQFSLKSMADDLRVRRHFVRQYGGSTLYLALWFLADMVRRLIASLLLSVAPKGRR